MSRTQITSAISIDAPPSVVFAIIADPRQHARIDGSGSVQEVVFGPDRLVLGSEFGIGMKIGMSYKMRNTVVEYEVDRLIAWRTAGPHRWRYQLEPSSGGTRVTETWDISPYPAPARILLRALFGRETTKSIAATLVNLKVAAEADSGT